MTWIAHVDDPAGCTRIQPGAGPSRLNAVPGSKVRTVPLGSVTTSRPSTSRPLPDAT